jgi:hypothetical protein
MGCIWITRWFFSLKLLAADEQLENAAIERGLHPADWTYKNISHMKKQLISLGTTFDWSKVSLHSSLHYSCLYTIHVFSLFTWFEHSSLHRMHLQASFFIYNLHSSSTIFILHLQSSFFIYNPHSSCTNLHS